MRIGATRESGSFFEFRFVLLFRTESRNPFILKERLLGFARSDKKKQDCGGGEDLLLPPFG
jgi:hypothetical protein